MTLSQSKHDIIQACDKIKALLLSKNEKYGDAALNPTRIMSKANAVEQILIRIDDKLNRINKGVGLLASDEDVVQDLTGYFILLMVALDRQKIAEKTGPRSIDDAWDNPPYKVTTELFSDRGSGRLLTPQECEDRGIPYTPQVNSTAGLDLPLTQDELDEPPGFGSEWDGTQEPNLECRRDSIKPKEAIDPHGYVTQECIDDAVAYWKKHSGGPIWLDNRVRQTRY